MARGTKHAETDPLILDVLDHGEKHQKLYMVPKHMQVLPLNGRWVKLYMVQNQIVYNGSKHPKTTLRTSKYIWSLFGRLFRCETFHSDPTQPKLYMTGRMQPKTTPPLPLSDTPQSNHNRRPRPRAREESKITTITQAKTGINKN